MRHKPRRFRNGVSLLRDEMKERRGEPVRGMGHALYSQPVLYALCLMLCVAPTELEMFCIIICYRHVAPTEL